MSQKAYIKFKCVHFGGYLKMVKVFIFAASKAKNSFLLARLAQIYSPLSEVFGIRYVLDLRVFQIL